MYGDGQQQRDCLHVDDVVRALASPPRCPTRSGEVFNLGHPDALGLGRHRPPRRRRRRRRRATCRLVPWPDDLARIDIGSFRGDFSKAKRVLGWEPEITFADGIAATIAFYREHPWYLSST